MTEADPDVEALLRGKGPAGSPVQIQPLVGGEENQNYHVSAGGQEYVLRVYSPRHSTTGPRRAQDIALELAFIAHLLDQGVPTPRVVPWRDGSRIAEHAFHGQICYAVLFEYVRGGQAAAYTPDIAGTVAATLLSIRKAGLGYPAHGVRPWPGDMVTLGLRLYEDHRSAVTRHQAETEALYRRARPGCRQIQAAGLPRGIIHGDVKLGNLLLEGHQVRAVVDFDDYRETYLLEELARTLMHDLDSPTRNAIRAGCFPIFHSAFAADPTVSAAELAHLEIFLQARFLYDVTTYFLNGCLGLVDDLFTDPGIAQVILRGAMPAACGTGVKESRWTKG